VSCIVLNNDQLSSVYFLSDNVSHPNALSGMSWIDEMYVYVCRDLFRKLEILPVPCQYILSLILFIIDNPNNFQTGLEKHALHTNVKINFSFQLQSSQVLKM